MVREITNKELRKALKGVCLDKILLYKDNGYFFIASDYEEVATKIAFATENCIYCNSFNQMTVDQWVTAIRDIYMNGFEAWKAAKEA